MKRIIISISLILTSICSFAQSKIEGLGQFSFTSNDNKTIQTWYYRPKNHSPNSNVLFVMHGTNRNAIDYRNNWINFAKRTGTLILAPEFSKENYPGSSGYHLGNIFNKDKTRNEVSLWTYTAIDMIFSHIQKITQTKQIHYDIYGHSAGAQFVHRMILFSENSRIRTAIAANAGWYTLPSDNVNFPYGLNRSPTTEIHMKESLAKHLIILLGEDDTDENHKYLRRSAEAMQQGKHRLNRGKYFFKTALDLSKKQDHVFNWELRKVPYVGHSNRKMSAAAALILEKKITQNHSERIYSHHQE